MLNEQAIYANAVHFWQNFTDVQRQVWTSTARHLALRNRLGVPRHLSGFQSFMRAAIPAGQAGNQYPSIPALNLIAPPAVGYNLINTTAAAMEISLKGIDPFASFNFMVFAGFSINHPVWKSPRRRRLVYAGPYQPGPTILLIPDWPTDFALPVTGWRIYLETRAVDFGSWPGAVAKADFIVT
jgi:hypothetical protein